MTKQSKKLLFLIIILCSKIVFGQNNNSDIFTVFNTFFDKEIKHQGIKGDWIFKLNEITGNHTFDFNNDGFNDIFMEFNAVPVDGGGVTFFYAVLFQNIGTEYKLVNYMECDNLLFKQFYEENYIFFNNKESTYKNFKLVNFKFLKIQ